ncbi:hypothetical protein SKAU_G00390600 [Synaphobranchus kaupii]|uniref:Uncharacterized protein n=1 Tax=Synaphobranchus kaupii TaxID=118154 RepID=A0A9Q1EBF6_SYNKA|nr:hypothetical protein SKAU_G00390600 [Synaphobranchus kaupii]
MLFVQFDFLQTFEGSPQDKMRSLVTPDSQADELKRVSPQGPEEEKDKDRERDAQLDSLKYEISELRVENQSLQTLFMNSENGDRLLKESFSQTAIIRLQGELQDLQRLPLKDSHRESPHFEVKSLHESQPGPEGSFISLRPDSRRSSSSSASTTQCRAEKQHLSGLSTPEDCMSVRSFASRLSGQRQSDQWSSSQTLAQGREISPLQTHISEAQVLIREMDTCVKDSFRTRLQEDWLIRAVIESLAQQNQAIGQELDVQTSRVSEMEDLLAEAYKQKAVVVSESQTAMEELQDFIRGRDKLLKELSEDYTLLKEEKGRLQSLFCDDGHGSAILKKPFHRSQPQINKMQGELQDLQRQQRTSSQTMLHLGLKAHEERAPVPEDSASVTLDLNECSPFLAGKLDEQHQNTVVQTGPAAAEGATHLRNEYKTKKFKV